MPHGGSLWDYPDDRKSHKAAWFPHTPPSQNDSRTFVPKHAKPEGLSITVSRNFAKQIKLRLKKVFQQDNSCKLPNFTKLNYWSRPASHRGSLWRTYPGKHSHFPHFFDYSLNHPCLCTAVHTGGQPHHCQPCTVLRSSDLPQNKTEHLYLQFFVHKKARIVGTLSLEHA